MYMGFDHDHNHGTVTLFTKYHGTVRKIQVHAPRTKLSLKLQNIRIKANIRSGFILPFLRSLYFIQFTINLHFFQTFYLSKMFKTCIIISDLAIFISIAR